MISAPTEQEIRRAQRAAADHLACGWPFEGAVVEAALSLLEHPAWDAPTAEIAGAPGTRQWARRWGIDVDAIGLSVPRFGAVHALIRALRGDYLPPSPERRGGSHPEVARVAKTRADRKAGMTGLKPAIDERMVRNATSTNVFAPDTLGWRGWHTVWHPDRRDPGAKLYLVSPSQQTRWLDPELRVEQWSNSSAVRGYAGIHALRVPQDVRFADPRLTEIGPCTVHGIVERFGRYVLGTEGWRAEWVVVKELVAATGEIAAELALTYPDVPVHVQGVRKIKI